MSATVKQSAAVALEVARLKASVKTTESDVAQLVEIQRMATVYDELLNHYDRSKADAMFQTVANQLEMFSPYVEEKDVNVASDGNVLMLLYSGIGVNGNDSDGATLLKMLGTMVFSVTECVADDHTYIVFTLNPAHNIKVEIVYFM